MELRHRTLRHFDAVMEEDNYLRITQIRQDIFTYIFVRLSVIERHHLSECRILILPFANQADDFVAVRNVGIRLQAVQELRKVRAQ